MTCSGRKTSEGEEELGAVVADIEPGEGGSKGVGTLFKSGDAGGVIVWGGDGGANPRDGAGPW